MTQRLPFGVALLAVFLGGCDSGGGGRPTPPPTGSGGSDPGGSGGASGSGGSSNGGSGGSAGSGGSSGAGGSVAPAPDAAPPADAAPSGGTDSGSTAPPPPPASGQGPISPGKIGYSQDFEMNMDGMSRSPGNLPVDRIQLVDDPTGQRGKVARIQWIQGDNFRTSGGTEPRSWFSAAMGYTIKPGTTVSVSWGFMWENPSMGAHFAQIIRDGGPLWMFDVDRSGNVNASVHRGSGGGGGGKIEAMKWYDFRVDTVYKGGGEIRFYINGKMIGMGRGDGGAAARFDCGTYWDHGAKATRTVYVSNVSIGELP